MTIFWPRKKIKTQKRWFLCPQHHFFAKLSRLWFAHWLRFLHGLWLLLRALSFKWPQIFLGVQSMSKFSTQQKNQNSKKLISAPVASLFVIVVKMNFKSFKHGAFEFWFFRWVGNLIYYYYLLSRSKNGGVRINWNNCLFFLCHS